MRGFKTVFLVITFSIVALTAYALTGLSAEEQGWSFEKEGSGAQFAISIPEAFPSPVPSPKPVCEIVVRNTHCPIYRQASVEKNVKMGKVCAYGKVSGGIIIFSVQRETNAEIRVEETKFTYPLEEYYDNSKPDCCGYWAAGVSKKVPAYLKQRFITIPAKKRTWSSVGYSAGLEKIVQALGLGVGAAQTVSGTITFEDIKKRVQTFKTVVWKQNFVKTACPSGDLAGKCHKHVHKECKVKLSGEEPTAKKISFLEEASGKKGKLDFLITVPIINITPIIAVNCSIDWPCYCPNTIGPDDPDPPEDCIEYEEWLCPCDVTTTTLPPITTTTVPFTTTLPPFTTTSLPPITTTTSLPPSTTTTLTPNYTTTSLPPITTTTSPPVTTTSTTSTTSTTQPSTTTSSSTSSSTTTSTTTSSSTTTTSNYSCIFPEGNLGDVLCVQNQPFYYYYGDRMECTLGDYFNWRYAFWNTSYCPDYTETIYGGACHSFCVNDSAKKGVCQSCAEACKACGGFGCNSNSECRMCKPGNQQCVYNNSKPVSFPTIIETCNSEGYWNTSRECPVYQTTNNATLYSACVAENDTASCQSCEEVCSKAGGFGCNSAGECRMCKPGETRCNMIYNELVMRPIVETCNSEGYWTTTQTCPLIESTLYNETFQSWCIVENQTARCQSCNEVCSPDVGFGCNSAGRCRSCQPGMSICASEYGFPFPPLFFWTQINTCNSEGYWIKTKDCGTHTTPEGDTYPCWCMYSESGPYCFCPS
ncbi:hypothetical protein HY991_03325 [Candidatus Micrarchaeota archaeon]|nr:hypothetical protein [Candidatus Micrarchaeota archaeon]